MLGVELYSPYYYLEAVDGLAYSMDSWDPAPDGPQSLNPIIISPLL